MRTSGDVKIDGLHNLESLVKKTGESECVSFGVCRGEAAARIAGAGDGSGGTVAAESLRPASTIACRVASSLSAGISGGSDSAYGEADIARTSGYTITLPASYVQCRSNRITFRVATTRS